MGRGHEDAHRLHVGEMSQSKAFVLHAVLRTDNRCAPRCTSRELDEQLFAVLGLRRKNCDVVTSEAGSCRAWGRSDAEHDATVGIAQLEPSAAERRQMGTTRDQNDLVAVFEEAPADGTADRAGARIT